MTDLPSWNELKSNPDYAKYGDKLNKTIDRNGSGVVSFLWQAIRNLNDPNELVKLEEYGQKQQELGAWVEGMLPNPARAVKGLRPIEGPAEALNVIDVLVESKRENLEAIRDLGEYPLEFGNSDFFDFIPENGSSNYPRRWEVVLDTSVLEKAQRKKHGKFPDYCRTGKC